MAFIKIIIQNDEEINKIIETRHVTFDEYKFPGTPALDEFMDNEESPDDDRSDQDNVQGSNGSDDDIISISNSDSGCSSRLQDEVFPGMDISIDDHVDHQALDENDENDDDSEKSSEVDKLGEFLAEPENNDDCSASNSNDNRQMAEDQTVSRFPRRNRRPPQKWFVASTVSQHFQTKISTSDDPTLKEAMSATQEERELWKLTIDDELSSLDDKDTWILDENPKSQPLPTHC